MHGRSRNTAIAIIGLLLLSCNFPTAIQQAGAEPDSNAQPAESGGIVATLAPEEVESVNLPENFGELIFEDGQWYLDGEPIDLVYVHTPAGEELWLTAPGKNDVPYLVRDPQGEWSLGTDRWQGTLSVLNATDGTIQFALSIDEDWAGDGTIDEEDLQELTANSFLNPAGYPPGKYTMRFVYEGSQTFDLRCSFDLPNNTLISFVAVSEGVAVGMEGFEPQGPEDLIVGTSPICGGGQ